MLRRVSHPECNDDAGARRALSVPEGRKSAPTGQVREVFVFATTAVAQRCFSAGWAFILKPISACISPTVATSWGYRGSADQMRSYHPWGVLNDESSFQPEAGECFNEYLSAVKGKILFNSSAGPGWYADARRDIVVNHE